MAVEQVELAGKRLLGSLVSSLYTEPEPGTMLPCHVLLFRQCQTRLSQDIHAFQNASSVNKVGKELADNAGQKGLASIF
jgi:hypothetical protein